MSPSLIDAAGKVATQTNSWRTVCMHLHLIDNRIERTKMDLFFSPLTRTPAAAAAVRLYSMRPNYTVVLVHDRIMPSNESIQQQHHKRERRATSG